MVIQNNLRSFFSFTLLFSCLFASLGLFADDNSLALKNIRSRDRQPGLYLTPPVLDPQSENHNFTTTVSPLAALNIEEIERYIAEHPEVKDYRLVIIGPRVRGTEAETFMTAAKNQLDSLGLAADVSVIRHPRGIFEKLTNLKPRGEDWEKPSGQEIKTMKWKILANEGLSFTVLLLPPVAKLAGWNLGPLLNDVIDKIYLPLQIAIPMVILDVANMLPLLAYRRFLSNHNIRLTTLEKFNRQFLMSMYFSMAFYMTAQWPSIANFVSELSQQPLSTTTDTVLRAFYKMLTVAIPASAFNMLSRTTVGTSLNIWEQSGEDRRFWTSVLEGVTTLIIAPIYILSTMPLLSPLVSTPIMELNAAHFAMLGIGVAGGASWAYLDRHKIRAWTRRKFSSCRTGLAKLFSSFGPDGTER